VDLVDLVKVDLVSRVSRSNLASKVPVGRAQVKLASKAVRASQVAKVSQVAKDSQVVSRSSSASKVRAVRSKVARRAFLDKPDNRVRPVNQVGRSNSASKAP
jgi:hypothetical protein